MRVGTVEILAATLAIAAIHEGRTTLRMMLRRRAHARRIARGTR